MPKKNTSKIDKKPKKKETTLSDKHKRVARNLVNGQMTKGQCYINVYPDCKELDTACVSMNRLLNNDKFNAYVQLLREDAQSSFTLSRQESLEYMAKIVRTSAGEVDADSDLCQEYTVGESGIRVKMPSKMDALKESSKIQGFYEPEKVELVSEVRKETPIEFTKRSLYEEKQARMLEAEQKALEGGEE